MAELLLPGDILSMTARAADRLMGAGNGDAALLYLWLLRRGGRLEPEAARRALKWDVPRLEAALSALVGLGLADGTAAPEAPPGWSRRARRSTPPPTSRGSWRTAPPPSPAW
ncbi:hypothetical protein M5E87_09360 [Flavonifractor plautii]|nr:hypothetical protein M5E87_09360 [Flavonifractor plautii]